MAEAHEEEFLSAFDFDLVRRAFQTSVKDDKIPEPHWPEHARRLLREMLDQEPDDGMIDQIIGQ